MATEQTTQSKDEPRDQSLSGKTVKAAEQVKQSALEQVDAVRQNTQSAKHKAAERVRKLGSTIRRVGEHLRIEDETYVAQKAMDVGQRVDEFANYVNDAEIGTLLRDTGDLARRNPAVFFGGAFVIGLAAGRFLRSGSSRPTQPSGNGAGS